MLTPLHSFALFMGHPRTELHKLPTGNAQFVSSSDTCCLAHRTLDTCWTPNLRSQTPATCHTIARHLQVAKPSQDARRQMSDAIRQMPDARRHTPDARRQMSDAGHLLPATPMPDAGQKPLDTCCLPQCCQMPDVGLLLPATRCRWMMHADGCHMLMDAGQRTPVVCHAIAGCQTARHLLRTPDA